MVRNGLHRRAHSERDGESRESARSQDARDFVQGGGQVWYVQERVPGPDSVQGRRGNRKPRRIPLHEASRSALASQAQHAVLHVDRETLVRRPDERPEDEWAGRGREAERDLVLRLHATQEDLPEGLCIDAARPLRDVVDDILDHCGALDD